MLLGNSATQVHDGLWIGSAFNACDETWFLREGISGVVNITAEVPNFMATHGIEYLNWNVRDEKGVCMTLEMLEHAACFIDRHRSTGGTFVHCFVGRSRSVAVCCYYLITRGKRSLFDAYRFICTKRPITEINTQFLGVLQRAESLRGHAAVVRHQPTRARLLRYDLMNVHRIRCTHPSPFQQCRESLQC